MSVRDARPCGARTRSGAPCRQPGMRTNGKCKMHGGKSPRGLKNANTRTGRYSKSFPKRLQERFEAAMSDRELLSLRKDISLIDAMITFKLAELRSRLRPERAGLGYRPTLGRMTPAPVDRTAESRNGRTQP